MSGRARLTPLERLRIGGFFGFIALLHAVGWLMVLNEARIRTSFVGFGVSAYLLGIRHAFDADHIAAVDDTIRYRMRAGQRPLGVGFFFSLGHSTVVLAITIATMLAASSIERALPSLREYGAIVGTSISGAFLWTIAALNLAALIERVATRRRCGEAAPLDGDRGAGPRGLTGRMLGSRLRRVIAHSWQMFPLGMLFGLGFDTASEIALLASAAGASASGAPAAAVLALPILFAAGMSALDTADGVLMTMIYGWASLDSRRRFVYDVTVTGLSVAVALLVGSIEWMQVVAQTLAAHARWSRYLTGFGLEPVGYVVVGAFIAIWLISAVRSRATIADPRPRPVRRDAARDAGGGAL